MMGKLLDSRLDPFSRKLESITETQEAQEEQIKQKTEARIRFEAVEKEVKTMSSNLNDCQSFVFENKTAIPEIKGDVSDLNKRLEKMSRKWHGITTIQHNPL